MRWLPLVSRLASNPTEALRVLRMRFVELLGTHGLGRTSRAEFRIAVEPVLQTIPIRLPANRAQSASKLLDGNFEFSDGASDLVEGWDNFWSGVEPTGQSASKYSKSESGRIDRNTLWRLHSLTMLDLLLLNDEGADRGPFLEAASDILSGWWRVASRVDQRQSMVWHDHATALRLSRVVRLYMLLRLHPSDFSSQQNLVFKIVLQHCRILLRPNFYSKDSNHGLDQAIAVLEASCVFGEVPIANRWRAVAVERLRALVLQQFGNLDRVHVENSPQYHFTVLRRLQRIRPLVVETTNLDLVSLIDEIIIKGRGFVEAIRRPDGRLPIIGDSEFAKVSPDHISRFLEGVTSPDRFSAPRLSLFARAGYAVVRGGFLGASLPKRCFHLVLKSGHLSEYHRHDDDNSFVVHAGGRDWLIDSGLYRHDETDPLRKYVRSAAAHNLTQPVPNVCERRPVSEPPRVSGVAHSDHVKISATSSMFRGWQYSRSIEFRIGASLLIVDTLHPTDDEKLSSEFESIFNIPADLTPNRIMNGWEFTSSEMVVMRITGPEGSRCSLEHASAPDARHGWTSPHYRELHPCHRLIFSSGIKTSRARLRYQILWSKKNA